MNHYNKEVFHSNTLSTIALTLTWNTFQLQDLSLSFIASYWEPWIWLPAIQNMPCQTHLYSSPGKSYPLGWVSSAHSFDKTISKSASSEASLALKSMNECENRKSRTDVCSKFGRKKVFYMTNLYPWKFMFQKNKHFPFWTWQGLGTGFVLLNGFLLTLTATKHPWINMNHSFHSQNFMLFTSFHLSITALISLNFLDSTK